MATANGVTKRPTASGIQRPLNAAPRPPGVRKHQKDNAADNVPAADIQVREPSSKKWQDELEDHQDKGKDDECGNDERKLRPLQRLAETGSHQHPSREDHRKIPDPEKKPSQPTAQNRPICEARHSIIKECQERVAQPSKKYAFRMVIAKPSPGKPCVATQEFWKAELCGHRNTE